MIELWQDLDSLYFTQGPNTGTQYTLPPFYAGVSNVNFVLHTLVPTWNPASPYTEVNATNAVVSLTSGYTNAYLNISLAPAGGSNLYLVGNLTIPQNTNMIGSNQPYADIFMAVTVNYAGQTILQETNVTLKTLVPTAPAPPSPYADWLALPTSDPFVNGQPWNNGGLLAISAGPL